MELLKAKRHSDKCEYHQKKEIIRHLLTENPEQFIIDSRQRHTVGLTHKPSRFKIHTLKSGLPDTFLQKTASRWRAMMDAGRLGASSLARLGVTGSKPLASGQAANQALRPLIKAVPAEYLTDMPNAPVVPFMAKLKGMLTGGVKPDPQYLKQVANTQKINNVERFTYAQHELPEVSSIRNSINAKQQVSGKLNASNPNNPNFEKTFNAMVGSLNRSTAPKVSVVAAPNINAAYTPWGGAAGGSYTLATNRLAIPSKLNKSVTPQERMAIGRHEVGHKDTLLDPNVGRMYTRALMPYMNKVMPGLNNRRGVAETIGHFRATNKFNINRASKAAIDLPTEHLQDIRPDLAARLSSKLQNYPQSKPIGFPDRAITNPQPMAMPQALRQRLHATGAHNNTNYHFEV